MRYENLIFDLYGTLVDIHTEEDRPELWQKMALYYGFHGAGYTPEELRAAYAAELEARSAQAGQAYECYPELAIEEVFAALLRQKGVAESGCSPTALAHLFRILSIDYIRLYPGVERALQALRQAGYRLWLLTNAQRVFTAYELRLLKLDSAFGAVYISSDYGCRKPDVRFFQALLQQRRLDPARSLMIGNDLSTDIAGAAAAGVDSLYLHTNLSPAADASPAPQAAKPAWRLEGADWPGAVRLLQRLAAEG